MNTAILNQYNISFQKINFRGQFIKTMYSPNLIFNEFVTDTTSASDVEDILQALKPVFDGTVADLSFSTNSLTTVHVTSALTKFYNDPDFDINTLVIYSLPTNDFKEIIISWKEYLEQ